MIDYLSYGNKTGEKENPKAKFTTFMEWYACACNVVETVSRHTKVCYKQIPNTENKNLYLYNYIA